MLFARQALVSVCTLSLAINFVLPVALVSAQRAGENDDKTTQVNAKRAEDIQDLISGNQKVKTMCQSFFEKIKFELKGDRLRIMTRNNLCAYTITQEVLQPQISEGKIRTYEYTGDRQDLIVTF